MYKPKTGLILFSILILPILLIITVVTIDSMLPSNVTKYEFILLSILTGFFCAAMLYIGDKLNIIIQQLSKKDHNG